MTSTRDGAPGNVPDGPGGKARWLLPLCYFWVALLFFLNNEGLVWRLLAAAMMVFAAGETAMNIRRWLRHRKDRPS